MALHPQAEAFLEWVRKERVPPLSSLSPAEARIWDARVTAQLTRRSERVARVDDVKVTSPEGSIPVRVYSPSTHAPKVLVYFHGGGWVLGDLDQVDYTCRLLANKTGRIVFSVDYRLAPEHKFPAAPEDCFTATEWIAENATKFGGDKEGLAVCGDSAGGNLTSVVCLMAQDHGAPMIGSQILIYPVTDLSDRHYQDFPDDRSPALTRADMLWFVNHYVTKKADLSNQYASPISRADLTGLPPAFMITAEYDILTEQCNTYAGKLRKAGVPVDSTYYEGMMHGFFTLPDAFDAAHDAGDRIARKLSETGV